MKERPYPRKCPNCWAQCLVPAVEDTTVELQHDGQPYTVLVPQLAVEVCTACGERAWSYESSGRIHDALRVAAGILTSDDIRAARLQAGVAPAELAALLGVHEAVYERWESGGQFQSRSHDTMLRVYFADPAGFRRDAAWPNVPAAPVAAGPAEAERMIDI